MNAAINHLIEDMRSNKTARKTVKINDLERFNQFIIDANQAINEGLLRVTFHPLNKKIAYISAGHNLIKQQF